MFVETPIPSLVRTAIVLGNTENSVAARLQIAAQASARTGKVRWRDMMGLKNHKVIRGERR